MPRILIRVESPDGTKRIELNNETLRQLYLKVLQEFRLQQSPQIDWNLYLDRGKNNHLPNADHISVTEVISHGDMIYLLPTVLSGEKDAKTQRFEEDQVDLILSKQNGLISRERDEQLCHHGPQGKCIHCIPVEPFDLEYLSSRTPPIKYVSFHGYLKKLQSGGDKGKYTSLEELNCKIKPGCTAHPPWPKGICNKCQPSTIYLNRQPYRHVDNIMFENGQIVEKFLNYWRKSGHQRMGFLYGRYEPYDGVPLGIRAVVSAIYEPPQTTSPTEIQLTLPNPNQEKINNLAQKLGLKCVGWIFTDLIMDNPRDGTVQHFRGNSNTYFLTAEECITAGYFQNMYKNYTKLSHDGSFGSKFVTVVVTGDADKQIHFEGYQVSNQCASLVRDGCIVPTYDAPELAYIKESSNEQFIPDVYFREKDTYNNEVTKIARPLPVEYLLVDLPAAFAKEAIYTFNEGSKFKTDFAIENRSEIGESQDFSSLHNYMKAIPNHMFLDAMSNFHLLIFLVTNQTVHFDTALDSLIEAIVTKNAHKAIEWSRTPEWLTIEHFFQAGANQTGAIQMEMWSCAACTFENEPTATVCNICQSPRT